MPRCPNGSRRCPPKTGKCFTIRTKKSPTRKSPARKTPPRTSPTRKTPPRTSPTRKTPPRTSPPRTSEFYFETDQKRCPKGFMRAGFSQPDLGIIKGVTCVMEPTNPKYHEWDIQKEIRQKRNKNMYGDENFVNGKSTFGKDEVQRWNKIKM